MLHPWGAPWRICCEYRFREYFCGALSVLAWDDLTGMKLEAGEVVEARSKEVGYIRDKQVYPVVQKIPISHL